MKAEMPHQVVSVPFCEHCLHDDFHKQHPARAEFLLFEEAMDAIVPLCEEHWNEICHMEGEENLTYVSVNDMNAIVRMVNEQLQGKAKQYTALLKEYSKLKGEPEVDRA